MSITITLGVVVVIVVVVVVTQPIILGILYLISTILAL